ncbi:MAG: DMT family transporter [Planctomycetia bacterium]
MSDAGGPSRGAPPAAGVTPRLQVLAAAALFSTGGTAIKLTQLSGLQVACLRSGVAAVALLLLSHDARRGWSWRTPLVGLVSALTLVLFVSANKLTTAANAIFLQATAPLYLLVLSPWLLRERVRLADMGFLAVMGAGLALFFLGQEDCCSTATDPQRGNLLAAASGFTWALTIAGLRWLARAGTAGASEAGRAGGAAVPATVAANGLGFLLCAPFAFPLGSVRALDVGVVLFLGVLQIAVAYLFLTASMRRVPAFEGALLLLLEPVLSALLAAVVHDEQPGPHALAGGLLIVGATLAQAWHARRRPAS